VGAELAKAMGEKVVVAILAGHQTAPNLQKRVAGVKEELKKFPTSGSRTPTTTRKPLRMPLPSWKRFSGPIRTYRVGRWSAVPALR